MKKISIIVGICIMLAAMPMTTAVSLFAPNHAPLIQHPARPTFTNGTFSGVFAMKNESGYIPLGNLSGSYDVNSFFGTFDGTWTMNEGNVSGTMSGWIMGYFVYGMINTTGGNASNWFLGLYRVNQTDNTFKAGAIIFAEDQHSIRYAMGSL